MKLSNVKGVVLDLDGCVYVGNTPVPGAPEAIEKLRKKIKIVFLTNNSSLTREQYSSKLLRMGIQSDTSEILTSGYLAAKYISEQRPNAEILVVGEDGVSVEAENIGLKVLDHGEWMRAEYVVVGLDRKLSYEKLADAALALQAGAKFVATNLDHVYPSEIGFLPGAGSIAALLITATGVKPTSVGKPEKVASMECLKLLKLSSEEVVFVGDRVDTDVAAAKAVKARSVLVKTGAFHLFGEASSHADLVIESIAELPKFLE